MNLYLSLYRDELIDKLKQVTEQKIQDLVNTSGKDRDYIGAYEDYLYLLIDQIERSIINFEFQLEEVFNKIKE